MIKGYTLEYRKVYKQVFPEKQSMVQRYSEGESSESSHNIQNTPFVVDVVRTTLCELVVM